MAFRCVVADCDALCEIESLRPHPPDHKQPPENSVKMKHGLNVMLAWPGKRGPSIGLQTLAGSCSIQRQHSICSICLTYREAKKLGPPERNPSFFLFLVPCLCPLSFVVVPPVLFFSSVACLLSWSSPCQPYGILIRKYP